MTVLHIFEVNEKTVWVQSDCVLNHADIDDPRWDDCIYEADRRKTCPCNCVNFRWLDECLEHPLNTGAVLKPPGHYTGGLSTEGPF